MNIDDLKVGDKIKFRNFIWDYSDNTGTIKYFVNRNRVRLLHQSGEVEIDIGLIICKLEPILAEVRIPQYKEIPIEKENLCKEKVKVLEKYTPPDFLKQLIIE